MCGTPHGAAERLIRAARTGPGRLGVTGNFKLLRQLQPLQFQCRAAFASAQLKLLPSRCSGVVVPPAFGRRLPQAPLFILQLG